MHRIVKYNAKELVPVLSASAAFLCVSQFGLDLISIRGPAYFVSHALIGAEPATIIIFTEH